MKPKILLIGGWGWAATSPLVYTLQRNAKYAHFGYSKTFRYYGDINNPVYRDYRKKSLIRKYNMICDGTWENFEKGKPSTHHMNHTCDLEPLRDFSLDHLHKLMSGDPTISKYMDFYHALHDHVITKGYKSLGDGCMGRFHVYNSREDAIKYSETLKSEFDVKVLIIARDPVRRAFSHYLYQIEVIIHKKRGKCDLPRQIKFIDYLKELRAIQSYYGKDNVYVTVMEELWERDGATELSEFLEHPITNLWKNLYAPDIGHLCKHDDDVPCQGFGQDLLELTPEMYWHYRKKSNHIYEDWKKAFGSLPLHWGEPL